MNNMQAKAQFEVNDVVTWEVVGSDGTFSTYKRVFGTVEKVNKVTISVLRADTQTKVNVDKGTYTLAKLPYDRAELADFLGALDLHR
jgi:hypothetical protein